MQYPKKLAKGDTIGLVGISGAMQPTTPETIKRTLARVERLGFRVKTHESVGQVHGYLSGTDALRAQAIDEMFRDETVDAIWVVRGGYGVTRILPHLDYAMMKANAKPVIGYSDVTALHAQLQTRCGMVSFHAPMPSSDELLPGEGTAQALLRALEKRPLGRVENIDGSPLYGFNTGEARGELVGGNLTMIASLCGTPYALDVRDKILFLEDVGERTYVLDRLLVQLRNAGYFEACAGIVLGGFTNCPIENEEYGLSIEEIIAEVLLSCGKPILAGLQAGHMQEKLTLPLGAQAHMDATARTLEFV